MGVVDTQSTAVTNANATQPRVINPSYLAGGLLRMSIGTVEVAAADSDASTYRFVRLPANAVIFRLEVLNDAIAGGTSYDLGLYKTSAAGGAVVGADVFATAIDMSVARTLPQDAMFEVLDIANVEKRLWELAALTADPMCEYDVCLTANTVGTAAGTISVRVVWTV